MCILTPDSQPICENENRPDSENLLHIANDIYQVRPLFSKKLQRQSKFIANTLIT